MSREGILSVKEKWALDAQLGELLRGLDPTQEAQGTSPASAEPMPPQEDLFRNRLMSLVKEYRLNAKDAVDIAQLLCQ